MLWEGIDVETSRSLFSVQRVRVALCCISSDIPATSKLCGFYGFKAKCGCSKCMKEFVTTSFSESTDYSGFEREQWPPRNLKIHHQKAIEAKNARSNAARTEIEREVGVRYSELLCLPYLDIVKCHLIDPMYNLFLGTAKNIHFGKLLKSFQKAHSHQFRTLLILYLFLPGLGDYLRK